MFGWVEKMFKHRPRIELVDVTPLEGVEDLCLTARTHRVVVTTKKKKDGKVFVELCEGIRYEVRTAYYTDVKYPIFTAAVGGGNGGGPYCPPRINDFGCAICFYETYEAAQAGHDHILKMIPGLVKRDTINTVNRDLCALLRRSLRLPVSAMSHNDRWVDADEYAYACERPLIVGAAKQSEAVWR